MRTILLLITFILFSNSSSSAIAPADKLSSDTGLSGVDARMEMTYRLRAKIMSDNQLSTKAHNISIITNPESITLVGEVASRAEKVKLENYARSMAGDLKVFNQLKYKR